jgi:hypothetical protein
MSKAGILKVSCLFIILTVILLPLFAFAETEQVQINDGWNLMAFPVTPQRSYTAESLGQEINSQGGHCDRIMRWDGGSFFTHLIGKPFGDFPLMTGEGYFVLSYGFSTWTVTGDPLTTLSQNINEGWTLVNAPFEMLTAESMGNSITSQGPVCDRIMLWDGGSYQTHLIGKPFGDFPIKKGGGYFVLCDAYGTWDFSITPVTKPTINTFTSPTSNPVQTLSGTKDANTSIWMNGVEKIPIDSFTNWSVSIALAEGQNSLSVTAKDFIGVESQPVLASILLDTTPPTTPVVTDDGATTNYISTLHAVWTAQDPQTDIGEYQYAIGTSSGGTDVVNWTSSGTQASVTATGLSLVTGKTYYFSVKAKNNVGLWGGVGTSDGIMLNQSAPAISSIAPTDGSLSEVGSTIPFNINATDLEGDPIQYKITVDGQVVSDWSSVPSFNWLTTSQASGIRQATIYVKDTWGNQSSGNIAIYLARKTLNTP